MSRSRSVTFGRGAMDVDKYLMETAKSAMADVLKNARGRPLGVKDSVKRNRSRSKSVSKVATRKRRRTGLRYLASKSSGFFKKGYKWRGRRFKKRRANVMSNYMNNGVVLDKETGINSSTGAPDGLFIGHTTFIQKHVRHAFYLTLIKMIFRTKGIRITNFHDVAWMSNNDVLRLTYKADPESTTTVTNANATFTTAGQQTYEQLATQWESAIGIGTANMSFIDVQYRGGDDRDALFIPLEKAIVFLNCKASLKLQNQTVAGEDDDEADDVNNIPINGKCYAGTGTGTVSYKNGRVEDQFVCDDVSGVLTKVGTVAGGMAEAPPPGYFANVKRFEKVHLDPGQIKTSVLVHKDRISLQKLCRYMYAGQATVRDLVYYGKYWMCHFEHVIKSTANTPSIFVAGEHAWRIGMSLKVVRSFGTDPFVQTATYLQY